jgi:hypothetical protein
MAPTAPTTATTPTTVPVELLLDFSLAAKETTEDLIAVAGAGVVDGGAVIVSLSAAALVSLPVTAIVALAPDVDPVEFVTGVVEADVGVGLAELEAAVVVTGVVAAAVGTAVVVVTAADSAEAAAVVAAAVGADVFSHPGI